MEGEKAAAETVPDAEAVSPPAEEPEAASTVPPQVAFLSPVSRWWQVYCCDNP